MSEREEGDKLWLEEAKERGWRIVDPAPWLFRLPIIRWFRFTWLSWRVHSAANAWGSIGIGIGGPNQYDRWVLYAIYRGWA